MKLKDLITTLEQLRDAGMGDFEVQVFDKDNRAFEPVTSTITRTSAQTISIRSDLDEDWRTTKPVR